MKKKILKEIDRIIKEECICKFECKIYKNEEAIKHLRILKRYIKKLK